MTDSPSAREVVTRRVVRRVRQYPQLELTALDTSDLDARDAGLASAIDHAVARRWLTLVAILESRMSRPWAQTEPRLQAALLVGAAQLLLLDRVPDHAAINEAVEIAKRTVRVKAGGLVNAVLRKVAALRDSVQPSFDSTRRDEVPRGDGTAWRLSEAVFAEDPLTRLAQQTSHPQTLLSRWSDTLGPAETHRVAMHDLVPAPIIVTADGPAPPEAGAACSPHSVAGFHVFTGPREDLDALLAANGSLRVQDPAAARAVGATAGLCPGLIIDVCAGRGTKTRQLAALHPTARIIATDVDAEKRGSLEQSVKGLKQVEVVTYDALPGFQGQADLVVVDVPCSNTGVLARRVEARYRMSDESLRSLVDLQRQILADTALLPAPSGRVLYSTCSVEPEENEEQTAWITRWHRRAVERSAGSLPAGVPGDPASRYADGGFFAVMGPGSLPA